MRILLIALGCLFGLPFFLMILMQLYGGFLVASNASDVASLIVEARDGPDDPLDGQLDVSGHRDRSGRVMDDYVALVSHRRMNERRIALVSVVVPIASLLDPGEQTPDPDFVGLFASARAHVVARRECALLTRSLAAECSVDRASGRVEDAGPGKPLVRIAMRLRYRERAALGEVADGSLRFVSVRHDLTDRRRGVPTSVAKAERVRAKLYADAVKACRVLRAREGNCAITGIGLDTRPGRGGRVSVVAQATLSALSAAGRRRMASR